MPHPFLYRKTALALLLRLRMPCGKVKAEYSTALVLRRKLHKNETQKLPHNNIPQHTNKTITVYVVRINTHLSPCVGCLLSLIVIYRQLQLYCIFRNYWPASVLFVNSVDQIVRVVPGLGKMCKLVFLVIRHPPSTDVKPTLPQSLPLLVMPQPQKQTEETPLSSCCLECGYQHVWYFVLHTTQIFMIIIIIVIF